MCNSSSDRKQTFTKSIALDSGFKAHMVGLDFSAAFDRVNHNALIYKLRQLSIGGPFLNILMDFLTDRKQSVVVDGHHGEWRNGVLRKLKHIFPNTYQRIKSICSPAKVGLVVTDLITSPVVSWRGWEAPPQHRGSAVILCMTSSEVSRAGVGPSYLFFGKY